MSLEKKYFALICFFCFCVPIYSQSNEELIKNYKSACRKNYRITDSLFYYSRLLLKIDDPSAQYEGYFAKAYAYRSNMQVDSATVNFQKALTYATDKSSKSRAIRMSLITAANAGNNKKALSFAKQMFNLAEKYDNDSLILANAYNQRGIIKKEMGNLEEAISNYVKAASIYKSIDKPAIVNTYTNIAIAYNILGQHNTALKWFKKAYDDAKIYKNQRLVIKATNNLANHYKTLENFAESKIYFDKLLNREDGLNKFYKSLLYQNLAEIAIYESDLKLATKYLNIAQPLIENGSNVERKIQLYSVASKLEKTKGSLLKSLKKIDLAINLAQSHQLLNRLFPLYLRKAEIHKQLQQFQPAATFYEKYAKLKDSLQQVQKIKVIQDTVAKYELDEREKDMKEYLIREKGLKNNLFITGGIAILFMLGGAFSYKRYLSIKLKNKAIEERAAEQIGKLEKLQHQLQENNTDKKIKLTGNHFISCNELIYVKSENHYLNYYVEGRKTPLVERQSLSELLEELEDCGFVRVHRSYIINTQKVKSVKSRWIILKQTVEVPFSRNYKKRLKEQKHPLFNS